MPKMGKRPLKGPKMIKPGDAAVRSVSRVDALNETGAKMTSPGRPNTTGAKTVKARKKGY